MNPLKNLLLSAAILASIGASPANAYPQRAEGLGFGLPAPGTPAGSAADDGIFGPEVGFGYRQLVADQSTWQRWWTLNREEFLDLESVGRIGNRVSTSASPAGPGLGGIGPVLLETKVLPVLEGLYRGEQNSIELRMAGLLAAARLASEQATPDRMMRIARQERLEALLADALESPTQDMREAAIHGLGLVGSQSALRTLNGIALGLPEGQRALGGREVSIRSRAAAVYGLGLASHRASRPSLRSYARHQLESLLDQPDVRHADLGTAVVLSLGLAPAPSPELGGLVQRLMDRLESDETERIVAHRIPTTLGRLAPFVEKELQTDVVETLLRILGGRSGADAPTRRAAALALGQIGDADGDDQDRRIRQALNKALKSRDASLRRYSALSLARVGSRPGTGVKGPAIYSKAVAKILQRHLRTGRKADRPWSALALGVFAHHSRNNDLADYRTARSLTKALRECRSDDRIPALALAAGLARAQDARPVIEDHFARLDGDEARGWLALSLGLMGSEESLTPLRQAFEDTHYRPDLRVDLALARAMLQDDQLGDQLLREIRSCDCWASTAGSARSLARVGDLSSLGALLSLSQDEERSDPERALAAEAMGWIASGDSAPWSAPLTVALDPVGAPNTLTEPAGTGVLDRL